MRLTEKVDLDCIFLYLWVKNRMIHPSILSNILSVGFMLLELACLVTCYSQIRKLGLYQGLVLTLLFSIAIGLHGVSHLGLEKQYGYNPARYLGL